jgi:putative ABC transport system permease protein
MLFWTIIKVSLSSLFSNKLRTFLAILGIIIGVGAVISMLAMGAGAQKQVLDRITSMGSDLLIVRPAKQQGGGVRSGTKPSLVFEDAEAIINKVSNIKSVTPVIRDNVQVKYFNNNTETTIYGTAATYFKMRNYEIEKGRVFTSNEMNKKSRVAVLGPDTAEELFGLQGDSIGETIKIKGVAFTVIGITKSKGDQLDDQIIVPFDTVNQKITKKDHVDEIDIQVKNGSDVTIIQADISTLLRKRHRIRSGKDDDFEVRNQAEIIETASNTVQTFTVLLGGIAGISLLVGGIGIMNIMLVTVSERTREIGVRKAIGAKKKDILLQFLIEAILLSGIGGLIGVGLGAVIAFEVTSIFSFPTLIEPVSSILSFGFSVAVGVFFGFYPAWSAAKLDPIQALRYE